MSWVAKVLAGPTAQASSSIVIHILLGGGVRERDEGGGEGDNKEGCTEGIRSASRVRVGRRECYILVPASLFDLDSKRSYIPRITID